MSVPGEVRGDEGWCGTRAARVRRRRRVALGIAAAAFVAIASPQVAVAQAVAYAQGITSVAPGTPTTDDPTILLARTPLCPSEAAGAADIVRASVIAAGEPRALVRVDPARPAGTCNPYQLVSNVHAEADTIYWVDNQGPGGSFVLWRKSRLANAADPATAVANFGTSVTSAELITYTISIFVIVRRPGWIDFMAQYDKRTGALLNPVVAIGDPFQLSNMQVDQRYLYWLNAGTLWRNDLTNGAQVVIATGVSSYFDEGYDEECTPVSCYAVGRIVYGRQNQLWSRYNLDTPTLLYTSPEGGATIQSITRDGSRYYFFERRPVLVGGFARNDRLLRLPLFASAPTLIYGPVDNGGPGFDSLHTDRTNLYFRDRATRVLYRLRNDAAALPVYLLRATGLEITQGIQSPTNSVFLVQGRRTFVRLYAQSDGIASVPNVDAWLTVFDADTQEFLGTLRPKNRGGLVNVPTSSNRMSLDDSFYFELPLEWTRRSRLSFGGTVNPTGVLVENDYGDNFVQSGAYPFEAPSRLPLHVISWAYNFGNTFVLPGGLEAWDSLRWIERLFPLPSTGGSIQTPGDGLRSETRLVFDDALATRVDRSDPSCASLLTPATPTSPAIDNRNMCAADYVLARIRAMRSAGELPQGRYYYGAIAGQAGLTPFTRGYAAGGDTIAMGPSRDPSAEQNYMAHEVGHLLGRGHPGTGGGGVCNGQDAADPLYPHPRARIGASTTAANDGTALAGFDFGDNQYVTPVVKGSSTRGDVMSYCNPYWISDYTYTGIYDWLTTVQPNGGAAAGAAGAAAAGASLPGDWLIAEGSLALPTKSGAFLAVQRRSAVSEAPIPAAGGWALQLRSATGAVLASHAFAPAPRSDEPSLASFSFVVPFAPGTRELRVVEAATGLVAASRPVSAAPPSVSNVGLVGAPSPVTGTVTASWNAIDPDGDPLRFDVLLSRDGGESFQPIALSLTDTSANLDTTAWGGGTAILRVVASDGVQTGVASSAPFTVASKAPIVRVASPAPNTRLDWGQVVNFTATVEDPQDAPLPDTSVVWSNSYRTLGTGRALSVEDLEVGVNLVTVTATNAAGLIGQATVTVLVGDDLTLPGPRVSTLPASIDVAVPGGETALQSASLDVVNPGGGVLSYVATSSATWLRVDGTSSTTGTAPRTVAVAIDSASLPDAAVSTAEILVYNALDLTDVVSVAVTVAKGDIVGGAPFVDTDGDGVGDRIDNCPLAANAGQADADGDGVGDACEPACGNGVDDDGDGAVDWPSDRQCAWAADPNETAACSNGVDDDGDGLTDTSDDACRNANDESEGPDCADGIDNDGDGRVDFGAEPLGDPGCTNAFASSVENPQCSNGRDDDGDGRIDFGFDPNNDPQCKAASGSEKPNSCGLGGELVLLAGALRWARRAARRLG